MEPNDPAFIELHEYRTALEEEFTALSISPEDAPDIVRSKARAFAIHHLSDAFEALADLLTSTKDATRLSAAKAIISLSMQTSPADDTDPITHLFEALSKRQEDNDNTPDDE